MKILPNNIAVIEHDTHISAWVEQAGRLDHDQYALPVILKHIDPGDWVVDAGAFIGDHTRAYLDRVGPDGYVVAFEINPEALECLEHNCPEAILVKGGLSDQERLIGYAQALNAGSGHVVETPGEIHLIPLDAINLERCDFIKLDIEGCELEALHGAVGTIRRCRPVMWIEVNEHALGRRGTTPEQLIEFIGSLGYTTWSFPPERGLQYDVLCIPSPTS